MHEYKIKPIGDLIPYANNSRTHSDEQITQVASSIKEFGFTNPVLIDEAGGKPTHLGIFNTKEEAGKAYIKAKNKEINRKAIMYPQWSDYIVAHQL